MAHERDVAQDRDLDDGVAGVLDDDADDDGRRRMVTASDWRSGSGAAGDAVGAEADEVGQLDLIVQPDPPVAGDAGRDDEACAGLLVAAEGGLGGVALGLGCGGRGLLVGGDDGCLEVVVHQELRAGDDAGVGVGRGRVHDDGDVFAPDDRGGEPREIRERIAGIEDARPCFAEAEVGLEDGIAGGVDDLGLEGESAGGCWRPRRWGADVDLLAPTVEVADQALVLRLEVGRP